MYSACICVIFQSDPRELYLSVVKRIIRYLKGTQNIGLWYDRNSTLTLNIYTDSDFADCKIDKKSTSGACQFSGSNLISWFSKKQHSIALSIAEAE